MKKAVLILPDNTIYKGSGIGVCGSYYGELVFNTGMTGYVESLTDPSYAGQILTFAYPSIGNYGVDLKNMQSKKIHAKAIVASEICNRPLEKFLEKNNMGGIVGIDTRSLIKKIRSQGTIPVVISVYDDKQMDLVKTVTTKESYILNPSGKLTVVLIDYGVKKSILENLIAQDLKIIVISAFSSVQEILDYKPLGIILSNGPGDPSQLIYQINVVKELISTNIPIWGICLGHQILALASGAKTFKLNFGHRGVNQPVLDMQTKKAYITSHNHGFGVDVNSLSSNIKIIFTNLNDGTIEGLQHTEKPWFSVQFHPEAYPGPSDTQFLFSKFKELL